MKILFALPLLITTFFAQGFAEELDFSNVSKGPLADMRNFNDFLTHTGQALNETDRTFREGVFKSSKNSVDAGNKAFAKGVVKFQSAINIFAGRTLEELVRELTGRKRSPEADALTAAKRTLFVIPDDLPIPDAFDWREKGGVTPVKDQKSCGSCWAFATTGAIEGHTFAATGKLPNLSEQNLVDCGPKEDFYLNGCDGGCQESALCWISDSQKGVSLSEKYPYVNDQESCKFQPSQLGAHVHGFGVIPPGDEELMKKVVATLGPIACSISLAESLFLYASGVYDDEECEDYEIIHSILVVGYGSEKGLDYWIVKNSWDDIWGEGGYFRLERGKNRCQIAEECSFPLITPL
nr:procathepsin L-like [Drosophila takahashii]